MNFFCFMCIYNVALISALVLLKYANLRLWWSKIRLEISPWVQLFTECILRHYIMLFYTHFCRLGLQTIDNGLVSLWHVIFLIRPNNSSGDFSDGCVNNFMSFFE